MTFKTLAFEKQGPVAHVWLDRPERRNALNALALTELEELYAGLRTEFDVRVVVLAGRGPSFCAGADRKDPPGTARMRATSDATDRERRFAAQVGLRACQAIANAEPVTVARVHGHAVGGGAAIALACDFRIATHDAIFHVPEVDLGIPLSWGATPRLIQEVGAARAREIILMCDRFDGRQAEQWGVVHRAVAAAELDATVGDWVARIVAKPEVAVHMTKTQFRAYALREALGDVTETDGDVLMGASRGAVAKASFPQE